MNFPFVLGYVSSSCFCFCFLSRFIRAYISGRARAFSVPNLMYSVVWYVKARFPPRKVDMVGLAFHHLIGTLALATFPTPGEAILGCVYPGKSLAA